MDNIALNSVIFNITRTRNTSYICFSRNDIRYLVRWQTRKYFFSAKNLFKRIFPFFSKTTFFSRTTLNDLKFFFSLLRQCERQIIKINTTKIVIVDDNELRQIIIGDNKWGQNFVIVAINELSIFRAYRRVVELSSMSSSFAETETFLFWHLFRTINNYDPCSIILYIHARSCRNTTRYLLR